MLQFLASWEQQNKSKSILCEGSMKVEERFWRKCWTEYYWSTSKKAYCTHETNI